MKGKILHISDTDLVIRSEEGNKYTAELSNIKSDLQPQIGDDIDFELVDDRAVEIYILRNESQLESVAKNAKQNANAALDKIRSQISEENLEKAKELGKSAKQNANAAFNKIRSQINEENLEKAKELGKSASAKVGQFISNTRSKGSSIENINNTVIENKFCFFSLLALLVVTFLPTFDGSNYYEAGGSNFVAVFLIPAIVTAYLGLKTLFYRILTGIALLIIVVPAVIGLYNTIVEINELAELSRSMSSMFGGFRGFGGSSASMEDLYIEIATDLAKTTLLMVVATIVAAITLIPGFHKEKQADAISSEDTPTDENNSH